MATSEFDRVERIFSEAVELPPRERAAFLDRECAGDADLRAAVEELLAHDEAASTAFLAPIAYSGEDTLESVGDTIGPYQLVARLGEGGFGVVYRAHQTAPVQRDVALKIIKAGMDTRQIVKRFEAERQTLARLDHPNTTRVYDAGATERGRPYFVMELVDGEPIVTFCARRELNLRERLDLFLQACAAIEHAHQRAIIHRDIKPSNVLVRELDGKAQVKVIDFGIARALDQDDAGMTLTMAGAVLGTPESMSPEQAAGLPVDTRTDVYSLGVLLYELICGRHPFADAMRQSRDVTERLRLVRELDPPRPSTQLNKSGASMPAAPPRSSVRGDLDWIVMRALEKDPARRYPSVGELAADIRRHLNHEPVHARVPSRVYRAKKFYRRNRVAVLAGSAIAAALVLGMVGLVVGLQRATTEAARARREAARSNQVAQLLTSLFEGVRPEMTAGRDAPVLREILAGASDRMRETLGDEPEVEAQLRHTIANTQYSISDKEGALVNYRRAMELYTRLHGLRHGDTLLAASGVANAQLSLGRIDEAEGTLRAALEPWSGANAPARQYAAALHTLASILRERGNIAEATEWMERAYEAHVAEFGESSTDALSIRHDLAALFARADRIEDAERVHREVYEARLELLGPDHPETLFSMNSLAYVLGVQGRLDEAEPFYRGALEGRRRVLGERHADTLTSVNNLAFHLAQQRRYAEAEALFREVLAAQIETLGESHPLTLLSMNNLGATLRLQERFEEAHEFLEKAYLGRRDALGEDHPSTLFSAHNLGVVLRHLGRFDEAADMFRIAAEGRSKRFGPAQRDTIASVEELARAVAQAGRLEEAVATINRALEELPADDEQSSSARDRLEGIMKEITPEASALGMN